MIRHMTSPDSGAETRVVDVRGRNIVVRELLDAQLLLLAREARLAQNPDTEPQRRLAAVGRIFDMLESAVVQESDRDYLLDLVVQRNLALSDMTSFVSAFGDTQEQKPRVRRGRASTKR